MENKHLILGGLALVGVGIGLYLYQRKKAGSEASSLIASSDATGSGTGTNGPDVATLMRAIPPVQLVSNNGVATPLGYGSTGGNEQTTDA